MLFFFRLVLLTLITTSFPVTAVIFKNAEDMNSAKTEGEKLKEAICPGAILADTADDIDRIDYASAVVLNERTVLSCSHIYDDVIKDFPDAHFWFRDYHGTLTAIKNIIPFAKNSMLPENDLAIFHLEKPVSYNPLNDVSTEIIKAPNTLSNISYGWTFHLQNLGSITNLHGKHSPYFHQTDNFSSALKTYKIENTCDSIIQITSGNSVSYYLDFTGAHVQYYLHDSGSPWFYKNQKGGYSLAALTCQGSFTSTTKLDKIRVEHDFYWGFTPYKFRIYELDEPRKNGVTLTALEPHREWIMKNCL